MSYQSLELWAEDRKSMEYMLDRLIVAKYIESKGKTVPDDYKFYYEGPMDYMTPDVNFDTVADFLKLSSIGKLKFRDEKNREVVACIQLFSLEEIYTYSLSESHKCEIESICEGITDQLGCCDHAILEGITTVVGSRIFVRAEGIFGPAYEVCEQLLQVHNEIQEMIKNIRSNPKGVN